VNGRFAVQQNAGPDRLFANVEQLIAEARTSNKAPAPVAAPAAPSKK
jgi:hypothetical protein